MKRQVTKAWKNSFGKYMALRPEGVLNRMRIHWVEKLDDATFADSIHHVPREIRDRVKPVEVVRLIVVELLEDAE